MRRKTTSINFIEYAFVHTFTFCLFTSLWSRLERHITRGDLRDQFAGTKSRGIERRADDRRRRMMRIENREAALALATTATKIIDEHIRAEDDEQDGEKLLDGKADAEQW